MFINARLLCIIIKGGLMRLDTLVFCIALFITLLPIMFIIQMWVWFKIMVCFLFVKPRIPLKEFLFFTIPLSWFRDFKTNWGIKK